MWAVVGLKTIWLVMALAFVGLQWQVLGFGGSLLMLAAATWSFGKGNRTLAIGLTWLGVLVAIAVGYYGGAASGPATDRIHDQFRTHSADFVFLAIAHLQFWAVGNMATKSVLPRNG
jgi:hypothetical protein